MSPRSEKNGMTPRPFQGGTARRRTLQRHCKSPRTQRKAQQRASGGQQPRSTARAGRIVRTAGARAGFLGSILSTHSLRSREHARVDRDRVLRLRESRGGERLHAILRACLLLRGVRDEDERGTGGGDGDLAAVRVLVALYGLHVLAAFEPAVDLEAAPERLPCPCDIVLLRDGGRT